MKKKKNIKIKIIKNFLDKESFKKLQDFVLGEECPWFYNKQKVKDAYPLSSIKGYESDDPHQFTHTFLRYESMHWSTAAIHLSSFLAKMRPRFWIRIKGNMSTINSKPMVGGWHCDMTADGHARPWTDTTSAIFYMNTNNGYTMFENGKKVFCEENKLATFPNNILHTGVSQTDAKVKVTLDLNYLDK
tara:strand:+ start:23 stop:586 length:564 start_codon:yes stop_codon:yes gene_type:complete